MMTQAQMDEMLYDLLEAIDHDIAKDYKEETAEEPEFAEQAMDELRAVVWGHFEAAGMA